jgi:hypothetical protein
MTNKKILGVGSALLAMGLMLSPVSEAQEAASSALKKLNQAVSELLKPFNSNGAVAKLVFLNLESNESRAVALAAKSRLTLKGVFNTFDLNVKEISYSYPNSPNALPKFKVAGKLDLDLVTALGKDQLNGLMEGVEDIVQDFAKEYMQKYGNAARITIDTTNKQYDEANNLVAQLVKLNFSLNTKALPNSVDRRNIEILGAKVEAMVTTKSITAKLEVIMNPEFYAFDRNRDGLKEFIDKLLAQDETLMENLQRDMQSYFNFISEVVNNKYEEERR